MFDHYTVRIVQKMMCLAEDEFRILRGKKLLCSVGVRQQILRYLLPEAEGGRLWLGLVLFSNILQSPCRHLTSLRLCRLVAVSFWAVLHSLPVLRHS